MIREEYDDCISREAVLGCLTATKLKGLKKFDLILHAREEIKNLPPITPDSKEIYNKGWQDGAEAIAYHIELCKEENPTIPMSVIEDIKAEIEKTVCEELNYIDGDLGFLKWCAGLKYSLRIIDKHIEDIGGK